VFATHTSRNELKNDKNMSKRFRYSVVIPTRRLWSSFNLGGMDMLSPKILPLKTKNRTFYVLLNRVFPFFFFATRRLLLRSPFPMSSSAVFILDSISFWALCTSGSTLCSFCSTSETCRSTDDGSDFNTGYN